MSRAGHVTGLLVLLALGTAVDVGGIGAGLTVAERRRVASELAGRGVRARDSEANFLLIDAADGWHEDLLRAGVIVRDGRALGAPGTLRVSVGLPEENDAFLSALSQLSFGELR